MANAETMWLRSQSAQRDFLNLFSYGTAFFGTAAIQALSFGMTAPRVYWAALGRAAAPPSRPQQALPATPAVTELAAAPTPEIVAPTPEEARNPAPEPGDIPSPRLLDAPRGDGADDLTALAGIGPKLAQTLNEVGIFHYDQIAALDELGIARLDALQKGFRMICARHDIVGQARALT